jgi:DNA-binding XRE family transcriptional regulator
MTIMGKRHPNHRHVKIHRSYTMEEGANVLGVHKNTIFQWIKAGLPTCDDKRPKLILGRELIAFLQVRRTKNKRTCRPGEIYCVRCRAPRSPAGDMADYEPITETFGNIIAICSDCGSIMNRRVSIAKLALVQEKMEITFPQAPRRLSESRQPTVNCDLG